MANLRANNVCGTDGRNAITGSVEIDGTGDYLTAPNSSDFRLGNSDFTVEGWAYLSAFGTNRTLFALFENATARRSYQLEVRTTGTVRFEWWYDGSTANNIDSASGIISLGSWNHYAVVRNGSTLTLYINGVSANSSNVGTNSFFENTTEPFLIGGNLQSAVFSQPWQGFVSNFRFIKGTALYTSNFIPPTSKLKNLPGTVLLCCQDSSNPLTEETGKTITGYGDLVQVGISTNLADSGSYINGSTGSGVATFVNNVGIITGTDSSNRGILYKTVSVIKGNKYEFSFRSTDASTNGKAGVDSNDGTNDVLDDVTNAPDLVYFSGSTVPNLDSTTGLFRQTFTATTNEAVLYFQEIGPGTLKVTDITVTAIDGRKGSNFTPSVGSDGSVEFAGPTTINTENYFYLPTGTTEQRFPNFEGVAAASARGLFAGSNTEPASGNTIEYITISSTGNTQDFGDRIGLGRRQIAAVASPTRAVFAGSYSPLSNIIDYVTITSTGNAQDFGDTTTNLTEATGISNSTRGIFAGGRNPTIHNVIQYVTIQSTGNSIDFGDLITSDRRNCGSCQSPTRGIIAGGRDGGGTDINLIDYITISTTGNSIDFGDLVSASHGREVMGGGNSTRGIFAGGGPSPTNVISYVTIASTGNATDFGDNTAAAGGMNTMACSSTRACMFGAAVPARTLSYVTIHSTGNATNFGSFTVEPTSFYYSGCSNGHGGLG